MIGISCSFVQEQQDFGFDLAKLETQAGSGWKS